MAINTLSSKARRAGSISISLIRRHRAEHSVGRTNRLNGSKKIVKLVGVAAVKSSLPPKWLTRAEIAGRGHQEACPPLVTRRSLASLPRRLTAWIVCSAPIISRPYFPVQASYNEPTNSSWLRSGQNRTST